MLGYCKYNFGFTAASLRLNDFVTVAQLSIDDKTIDHVNLLGTGNSATGSRMLREYNKRLSTLTTEQVGVLVNGILPSQKQIAFLAICKTYSLIRDFTIEVIREKLLLFDNKISDGDFISFLRRKVECHPELEKISDKTGNKIRQVTFKILEQAGIIDNIKNKTIQSQIIEKDVQSAITLDDKEWLRVLLLSDIDIKNVE